VLLGVLLGGPALARPDGLPAPILDAPDVVVYRVETACNSYLITCKATGRTVIVDPGVGLDAALAAQAARGRVPQAIWITHEHADHVSGLGALAPRLKVPVVAHPAACEAIETMRLHWRERGYARMAPVPPTVPDTKVDEGDVLEVGRLRWQVLHLPGHAPGSLGFLLPGRLLVAGDVLFQGSIGRTDLPTSDPDVFARTLGTKLWDLPGEVVVLPGHGRHTTIGAERRGNRLFQDFARKGRGETPVPRPWMGIQVDQAFAGPGARLTEVVDGSPAAAAGLRAGDVITALDGAAMRTFRDLVPVIDRHAVGDEVPVAYLRDGTSRTARLVFGARP